MKSFVKVLAVAGVLMSVSSVVLAEERLDYATAGMIGVLPEMEAKLREIESAQAQAEPQVIEQREMAKVAKGDSERYLAAN
ncbi:hypothetical protein [Teredinibacter turnerae]|uniref:Uncharacterized protein n=1 Tax=Teredinibacter turnerae (strain ATCC 39867 / T7901) TaxID=377629 RepID=C5BPE8_TERTT|nr:hypothetical protein [Teredinibacter turnerae]ACR11914.1 hypothetical protein TERTU_0758 [Teredinibacter turnerae T7901]